MSFFGKKYQVDTFKDLVNIAPTLRSEINEKKIILIRGLKKLSKEAFVEFSSLVAGRTSLHDKFISWDFGILMELEEGRNNKNYLFSNEKVPFHWDGAFHEVPNILVFNSKSSAIDGRTLFVNTEKILQEMSAREINTLEKISIEYETKKIAHYGGKITQKLVDIHPVTGRKVLRYGEEVKTEKNPVKRKVLGDDTNSLINEIDQKLYEKKYCYAHEWEEGDILLADNFSLLHGRESFESRKEKRHLMRLQIR